MVGSDCGRQMSIPDFGEAFWQLVAEAKDAPGAWEERVKELSDEELKRFLWDFRFAADTIAGDTLSAEGTKHFEYDFSEDSLRDLAHWVVMQGPDALALVWEHPAKGPIADFDEDAEYQSSYGKATIEHLRRFGHYIPACEADPLYKERYG